MRRRNRLGGDKTGSRTSSGAEISAVLFYSSKSQLEGNFSPRGIFGNVWRRVWWSQLGGAVVEGCLCLVDGGQERC